MVQKALWDMVLTVLESLQQTKGSELEAKIKQVMDENRRLLESSLNQGVHQWPLNVPEVDGVLVAVQAIVSCIQPVVLHLERHISPGHCNIRKKSSDY
jgi:hypothetical protein